MAYPLVHIVNSTDHNISGKVNYASAFCSDDSFTIGPKGEWTASSRGACLVTQVYADVNVAGKSVRATPYTSSGTSYSEFAVIETAGSFSVTRVITGVEDIDVGVLEAEPAELQK